MSNLQSRALRVFDNTTNIPTSYPVSAIPDQKSGGALTHISSASKVPTPPIETFFNPSNFIHRSAIDSAYEQKNSGGSRKFAIYPTGAKNTFVYEASVSSKSDFYDDDDSFFSAPDDASSILARSSLETLPSVYSIGQNESDFSDHSPSRIVPPSLPALIEAQNNYNSGVINVALPEGMVIQPTFSTLLTMHYTGSVSSDSDTDSTITEGPYGGQDSTAMHRYYGMMSSRPIPVPEDRRILPPPSQPQPSIITPRTPSISPPTGIVGPTRPPAPVQRLQDAQTPMPRDSLALQSTPSMQRQDSGYGGRAVVPRRPSLEREQRPILPPGLSTSPGAHSISGQPPPPSTYTPVRPRRDSLSPPVPPTAQSRRESVSLGPQPSVQPVVWDPISAAVTQPAAPSGRRDSVILAPQRAPSIHRNSLAVVPQAPAPVRRATDPLPVGIPPPITPMRRASESGPRGQGTLVSTRVRFNDENLICPSPIPMHERRKGFHNRRGYVLSRPSP